MKYDFLTVFERNFNLCNKLNVENIENTCTLPLKCLKIVKYEKGKFFGQNSKTRKGNNMYINETIKTAFTANIFCISGAFIKTTTTHMDELLKNVFF